MLMQDVSNKEQPTLPRKRLKITAGNGLPAQVAVSKQLKRVATRKRAKLAILTQLPLDILFEVFSHLPPIDVLRLSRTTKTLRNILMRKSAMSVWKGSLTQVEDLPECPPDMSLPAFVNLLFDHHCHNCLIGSIRTVDFHLRKRLCNLCADRSLMSIDNFQDKKNQMHKIIRHCIPFSRWNDDQAKSCLMADKNAFLIELSKVQGERNAFVQKRRVEVKQRQKHADKCKEWANAVAKAREYEREDIRWQRAKDIEARLKDLGWGEELEKLPKYHTEVTWSITLFHEHSAVRIPKPLTDRAWDNIKFEMECYMKSMQDWRLERERNEVRPSRRFTAAIFWRQYQMGHPSGDDLLPGPIDFWGWDKAAAIIEQDNAVAVTFTSFQILDADIPEFVRSWRSERLRDVISLRRRSVDITRGIDWETGDFNDVTKLKLAVWVMRCTNSDIYHESQEDMIHEQNLVMWYPEFLHHGCSWICLYDVERDSKDWDKVEELPLAKEFDSFYRQKWSHRHLEFDHKASQAVEKILKVLGLSVYTAASELDALDPRLVCLKCSYGHKIDGARSFPLLTWRESVRHCVKTHWGSSSVEWQVVSDQDCAEARSLEHKVLLVSGKPMTKAYWRCLQCKYTTKEPGKLTDSQLEFHINEKHYTGRAGYGHLEGRMFQKAHDAPPVQQPIVRMVPRAAKLSTAP